MQLVWKGFLICSRSSRERGKRTAAGQSLCPLFSLSNEAFVCNRKHALANALFAARGR